jgi:diguanylate cyclase (GGDEF)-like protein
LFALAGLLWAPATAHPAFTSAPEFGWLPVAALVAAGEFAVVHVHSHREAHAISLSELALICALFFAAPVTTVIGRAVGALTIYAVVRRQSPLKLAFNAALNLAETCTALAVFHLVGSGEQIGPRTWAAALAATLCAAILTAVAVSAVIAIVEGLPLGSGLLPEIQRGAATSATVTVVGLVAVHALTQSVTAAVPLAACLVILLVGYRRYAWLRERHLGLERLHRSRQALQSSPGLDDALMEILQQTRDVTRAEHAEIVFLDADVHRASVRVDTDGGRLRRTRLLSIEAKDPLWADMRSGNPVVVARGTPTSAQSAYLVARGLRDAIIAPLYGDAGVVGVLVAGNHASQVLTFADRDVPLLQAVANQAGLALQRGELAERLRHEELHDALTGLPNRVHLQSELKATVGRLQDGSGPGVAIIVLDLIGFREVNEVLGSLLADSLLREVGTRLGAVVGPVGMVARLGSDEFAALIPGVTGVEAATAEAKRVSAALERAVQVDGVDIEVSACTGVSVAPRHGLDADLLLKRAETALHEAKRSGSGLQVFEPQFEKSISAARLALLGELRQAIQTGEMQVFVQPQAELDSGLVVGAEALVRWHHPIHGFLPPDEFIPLAERSGLIRPLTAFVLARAVAICGEWRRCGLDLSVGVNLSARSILDPGLVDAVRSSLSLYGVPPARLTLEITESSVLGDPGRTRAVLAELRATGVRLSVDDFGTGYASLAYLRELPVDEVKIDKSFVMAMDTNPDDEAIVRSVIDLAANLGLDIVAEGVESHDTWQRLTELGCTLAQGYHLARPMPDVDLLPWLKKNARARALGPPSTVCDRGSVEPQDRDAASSRTPPEQQGFKMHSLWHS